MNKKIKFNLNGEETTLEVNPLRRLLDLLREDLKLISPKEGCGQGECGACSVILNGNLVNSCCIPVGNIEGAKVITIEGLIGTKEFNILKESFDEAGAVQCGFCTPGMIIASYALLTKNSKPNEDEIRSALSGNLCRCTGYDKIIDAVKIAVKKGENIW
ncbi:nicotinate dehydrogenase small FeS subunit [Clostridium pasteurianum DSM 525 = ATCC 6013]|uniref:Nicotinate dehydrogenase small FeS subunit n=1 Tax=Clostridium pasteurianum DSM 525 = ATCC 6013 TaxID=1262449 RepID=A0A0H3J3F1_CLOPA|nr:(2Fe-2S)-binding protein [Clostridium pasteurianum]AJA46433.1 nicotinate dehydrogenase small FeS subunit [Clostridium pasteurianum DSM 525 = ATCC 6013]AJA50421.1 nicotinate dehydrogenase small FeS subunit [Clostridium pasteurianum DSM 525 = ATCC 6013]AOZ73868.1 ferredoxin [Clostridium pasteurianum DSM 525 = ATCC 6013]AOZ77665.1 ferredoxin [Clostridium pasteurianum]ELP61008.1 oxidoreductase iron-sulfur-binding subunit [Clostridium pasteurianum DSM 525 = ATCC 6013]